MFPIQEVNYDLLLIDTSSSTHRPYSMLPIEDLIDELLFKHMFLYANPSFTDSVQCFLYRK